METIYGKCPICGQSNTMGHACSSVLDKCPYGVHSSNYCRMVPDEELSREELIEMLNKQRELTIKYVTEIYDLKAKINLMEQTYRMFMKDTGK